MLVTRYTLSNVLYLKRCTHKVHAKLNSTEPMTAFLGQPD